MNGTAATGAGSTSSTTNPGFAVNSRTDYTDGGAGISSSRLTIRSATMTNNSTCGAAGSGGPFTTATTVIGTTNVPITVGYCYVYTLTGTDNVGNSTSISTTVKAAFGGVDLDRDHHVEQPDSLVQLHHAYGRHMLRHRRRQRRHVQREGQSDRREPHGRRQHVRQRDHGLPDDHGSGHEQSSVGIGRPGSDAEHGGVHADVEQRVGQDRHDHGNHHRQRRHLHGELHGQYLKDPRRSRYAA